MLQAILFDLDGTLLPMDNDYFVKVYFGYLAKQAAQWGYTDPELLVRSIWDGVAAMVKNDGGRSNAEAFWDCFAGVYGQKAYEDIPKFDRFYATEFDRAKEVAFPHPLCAKAVKIARQKSEHVILATNPIFPRIADVTRLKWIDMTLEDFDLVTDYENCRYSKPNPAYYQEILDQFSLDPAKCLMVGNDVDEDVLAASAAGIPAFLLNTFVINRKGKDVQCPQGGFEELIQYLEELA